MAYFDGIRVGDRVWDFCYSWGTVKNIANSMFKVKFDNVGVISKYYNLNGIIYSSGANQTLFWNEVKFEIPKKPKIELKEGTFSINFQSDSVLTRNDKETAKKALKQIKRFTRLLALRDQECPNSRGYEFNKFEYSWSTYYEHKSKKWYVSCDNTIQYMDVYFKTKEDAQKICDILNSGRFTLEGEELD